MIKPCECGCGRDTDNPRFVHGHNRASNPRFDKSAWASARSKANRTEMNSKLRVWRSKNPDKAYGYRHPIHARKYQLKRYGLTLEDYNRLFEKQGGVCAICGQPETRNPNLSVDHDHETGKVRGLLCDRCNRLLGLAEDNASLLDKAQAYLMPTQESQHDPESDGPDHGPDEIDDDEPEGDSGDDD